MDSLPRHIESDTALGMEEPMPVQVSSVQASSSPSGSTGREFSGAATTLSSALLVRDEEVEEELSDSEGTEENEQPSSLLPRRRWFHVLLQLIGDDTWPIIVVLLAFWFFVSLTVFLGVFSPSRLVLGPNSSVLFKPNPLFIEDITVEELEEAKTGSILYGLHDDLRGPELDVVTTWSETHITSLPGGDHKEWEYSLNEGSQINISFSINSPIPSSLILVVVQGSDNYAEWREKPSYPNTTLSWNIIHGSGIIQQDILKSSSYYVVVANLNQDQVEVQLNLRMKAFLYNTTDAYYSCNASQGKCTMKIPFPEGSVAVLTTPGPDKGTNSGTWHVRVSYGPRWVAYFAGIGGMTAFVLLAFYILNNILWYRHGRSIFQSGMGPLLSQRGHGRSIFQSGMGPLLSQRDDDLSSSSYDSLSQDNEDLEDWPASGSLEGKPREDGECSNKNHRRRRCAICFDAPRECFFVPCGHYIACLACGTRIAELAGTCPICRRNLKRVKRLYAV